MKNKITNGLIGLGIAMIFSGLVYVLGLQQGEKHAIQQVRKELIKQVIPVQIGLNEFQAGYCFDIPENSKLYYYFFGQ